MRDGINAIRKTGSGVSQKGELVNKVTVLYGWSGTNHQGSDKNPGNTRRILKNIWKGAAQRER